MGSNRRNSVRVSLVSFSYAAEGNGWSGQTASQMLPRCIAAEELLEGKNISQSRAAQAQACTHYVAGFLDGFQSSESHGAGAGNGPDEVLSRAALSGAFSGTQ
jgi:hypothetical protein